MAEFNNIEYKLTDSEKFALICGMIAGLRLQDKTIPPDQVVVTLKPIGVNGTGTIGIMAEDVQYTGVNKIKIPVITHDVDREYSGFSLRVKYNNSQIVINSISEGEFGKLQGTKIQNGIAYTRCMLEKGQFKSNPCILCYLNCTIVSPPTANNPIELVFENNTGYNPNYCTLLTWVLNEADNNYYSYFITPTDNKGCKITSAESTIPTVTTPITDTTQTSALGSPSLVAMGSAIIYPGSESLIPIYTNCNVDDDFLYNAFKLQVSIPKKWLNILTEIGVGSTGEWTVSYTKSYNSFGDLVLYIEGTRAEAKADNSTVGFIRFLLDSGAVSIDCLLENLFSELLGPKGSLGVIKGNGYLSYPPPPPGSGGGGGGGAFGWGAGGSSGGTGIGSGGGFGGATGGGTFGTGNVWSGSSQDVWIDMGNGNKYPVHLNPGYNVIYVWVPAIFPEDTWIETTPTIEAPGYILIPGGFEWETFITPEAPIGLSSPRITDRYEIKDLYDIYKVTPEPPINLDSILDEYNIEDDVKFKLSEMNILMKEFIDTFEINDTLKDELVNIVVSDEAFKDDISLLDVFNIDIEHPPTTYDLTPLDEFTVEDENINTLVNLSILNKPEEEHMTVEDLQETETLECKVSDESPIEELNLEDILKIDILQEGA